MPFTSFALPFFHPRRPDIAAWLLLLPVIAVLQSAAAMELIEGGQLRANIATSEPWRLVTYIFLHPNLPTAIGNAAGLVIGMTMAARTVGPLLAWLGVLGATVLPGLWLSSGLEGSESMIGASPVLYGCLAMGGCAWLRMRHELTYSQRSDRMAGFATWALVAFALAVPLLLQSPVRGVHTIGFLWGGLLVGLGPRHWLPRSEPRETGFPAPGAQPDQTGP
jgi:membrane associated rhomboid family serine protease